MDDSLQEAGFRHWIPVERLGDLEQLTLLALALSEGRASPLPYDRRAEWIAP